MPGAGITTGSASVDPASPDPVSAELFKNKVPFAGNSVINTDCKL